MATCEKCWADAHLSAHLKHTDQIDEYRRLLAERVDEKMCTPEQQCGDLHVRVYDGVHCRCGKVKQALAGGEGV